MTEAEANAWLISWFKKDAQELDNRAKKLQTLLPHLHSEGSRQQIKAEIDYCLSLIETRTKQIEILKKNLIE